MDDVFRPEMVAKRNEPCLIVDIFLENTALELFHVGAAAVSRVEHGHGHNL